LIHDLVSQILDDFLAGRPHCDAGVDHGGGQTFTPADAERLNAAAGLASLAFAKVSYLRVFARSTARWVEVDDNGNANAASGQNLQKPTGLRFGACKHK